MEWLWGFLWFGLAVCGVICVKRCGWPKADEELKDIVAEAVAKRFVKNCGQSNNDEEKAMMLNMQRIYTRSAIDTYVTMSRKWW